MQCKRCCERCVCGSRPLSRRRELKQGGSLRVGTRVLVLPSRQAGAVKTLAVDGAPAALAMAGDSADVSLTDGADTVRMRSPGAHLNPQSASIQV